jgi:F-type H+-transporting ATPase subunit gamma
MASNTKEIQRRIRSIRNTRKITRAMEMVSVAKMKKEVDRVLSIRPYANAAWGILGNLSKAFDKYDHGLLKTRKVKNILVVLVTANRGLCGGYNSQVIKRTIEHVKNPKHLKINRIGNKRIDSDIPDSEIKFDFIAVGKKGFDYLNSRGYNVIAYYDNFNYLPSMENVYSLASSVIEDYEKEKYDKVVTAYTNYINTMIQEPKLRQILPISKIDIEKQISEMGDLRNEKMSFANNAESEETKEQPIDYIIEPEPRQVLAHILPRLVEMQLYHSILESNASKESARMMAMKNATEAASEMMDNLQYLYNQVRQTNITQEIAEITSGRVALEE